MTRPTFFDIDIPTLLEWQFTPADTARITAPVLYVGGTDSGPLFAEVRTLFLTWLPWADDATIMGADHSLAISHPPLGSPRPWLAFFSHTTLLRK